MSFFLMAKVFQPWFIHSPTDGHTRDIMQTSAVNILGHLSFPEPLHQLCSRYQAESPSPGASTSSIFKRHSRDFPGSPVVNAPCFQCSRHRGEISRGECKRSHDRGKPFLSDSQQSPSPPGHHHFLKPPLMGSLQQQSCSVSTLPPGGL